MSEAMRSPRRRALGAIVIAAMLCGLAAQAQDVPAAASAERTGCALDATEIFSRTSRSVGKVFAIGIDPMRVVGRVRAKTGSAIAIGPGTFVTNDHVIAGTAEVMLVVGDAFLPAEVVGRDPVLDVAVLFSPDDLFREVSEPIRMDDVPPPLPGQRVYVVGYPLGLGRSINGGMVSGVDRFLPLNTSSWLTSYIQTDAAISPGNSGGALLDECGRLLGMVSLKSPNPAAENLGYALPLKTLEAVVPELIETGRVARPWHGIYGQMVTPLIQALIGETGKPPAVGFLVETVEPGSAADRAGLRGGQIPILWGIGDFILGGDVITAVNGTPIETLETALEIVRSLEIGAEVEIDYLREGAPGKARVTIEERPFFESDGVMPGTP